MWKLDGLQELAEVEPLSFTVSDSSDDTELYTDEDGYLSGIERLDA